MDENAASFTKGITISIHMMWFGATAVEFQNGKIPASFQLFNGLTPDIIPTVIKF